MAIRKSNAVGAVLLVLVLVALLGQTATAQLTQLGDVYYQVHVDQSYKYGPFIQDVSVWENIDIEGIAPSYSTRHDSLQPNISDVDSVSFRAEAGTFSADLVTQIVLSARTGMWNSLVNTLRVSVYIKGNTGSAYHVELAGPSNLTVSRLGGLDGAYQDVNGASVASFMDSTRSIDSTGVVSGPVYEQRSYAGTSTTQITVGADTYSLAGTYVIAAPAQVTQAYCILGCMVAAADFNAISAGHVEIDVYPCQPPLKSGTNGSGEGGQSPTTIPCADVPTGLPDASTPRPLLTVDVAPNPFNPTTVISFQAAAGAATRVEVFDLRGRLMERVFDGRATGSRQSLAWSAAGLPSGVYIVRVQAGGSRRTCKLTLLE